MGIICSRGDCCIGLNVLMLQLGFGRGKVIAIVQWDGRIGNPLLPNSETGGKATGATVLPFAVLAKFLLPCTNSVLTPPYIVTAYLAQCHMR